MSSTALIQEFIKSMDRKFLQDIYLEYFVIFLAGWLQFGTDTTQSCQSCMALLIFVRYPASAQNMATLRTESFPCYDSINAVLTGFSSTRHAILSATSFGIPKTTDTFNKNKLCHMTFGRVKQSLLNQTQLALK